MSLSKNGDKKMFMLNSPIAFIFSVIKTNLLFFNKNLK